jgi:hypothetical protein
VVVDWASTERIKVWNSFQLEASFGWLVAEADLL